MTITIILKWWMIPTFIMILGIIGIKIFTENNLDRVVPTFILLIVSIISWIIAGVFK